MPSKEVTNRQKSASAVVAAGETHADRVATELTAMLSPHLKKGEKLPNIALCTQLVARALADARDRMVAADEAHLAELSDDVAPREARDETFAELSGELAELREWLTGLYGAAAVRRLGFSDITPRDPVALERFAGEVSAALSAGPLPKPRRKGVKWDPAGTVQRIEDLRKALKHHMKDVSREVREAEATLMTKNAALSAYDERFARVATYFTGLFRLAGQVDLADRVRPSVRRAGQTEADAPAAPSGSDAPASDAPADA